MPASEPEREDAAIPVFELPFGKLMALMGRKTRIAHLELRHLARGCKLIEMGCEPERIAADAVHVQIERLDAYLHIEGRLWRHCSTERRADIASEAREDSELAEAAELRKGRIALEVPGEAP